MEENKSGCFFLKKVY